MPEPAKKSLGYKILKISGIVFACLIGLILVALILLFTFAEPYAARYLKKQVAESTDSLYRLDFEALDLSLLKGSVALQNLHFSPDSAVHARQRAAGEASQLLLELEAAKAEVAGFNIISALLNNSIKIRKITVEKPQITLYTDERVEKNTAADTATNNNQEKGLASFMESLEVGTIDIVEGSYQHLMLTGHKPPRHQIANFSLHVHELRLDSLDQPDHTRMLNANDIQVKVQGYAYRSPDSVYKANVGIFDYGSKSGELVAEAVEVLSNHQANQALRVEEASRSIYDIKIPSLQITGMDVVEAYKTKALQLNTFQLDAPDFSVLKNFNIPAREEAPQLSDLYNDISDYLKSVSIAGFNMTQGKLTFRNKIEEIITIHELLGADAALAAIQIDSSTLFHPREHFFTQAIEIATQNYTYRHPHNPHTVQVAGFQLSTRDKFFQADSVQIMGDSHKNAQLKQIGKAAPFIYNVSSPRLLITELDIIRAYQSPDISIGKISIQSPDINLLEEPALAEAIDVAAMLKEAYTGISAYAGTIRVAELALLDASFKQRVKSNRIKLVHQLNHGTLRLIGITIDSTLLFHPDAATPVQEALLVANDYTYVMPDNTYTFRLGSLRYATTSQRLTARTLDLTPDRQANERLKRTGEAKPNLYDLHANKFSVTGLDVVSAFNTGSLRINEVTLQEPTVAVLADRNISPTEPAQGQRGQIQEMFSLFEPITANAIRLTDGTFTFSELRDEVTRTQVLQHVSATVTGLHLSSKAVNNLEERLPVEDLILTARDYTYVSPDSLYTFALDSLHYSSRQQLLIARSLEVTSDEEVNKRLKQENKANRNLFDVAARKFRITGFDLINAYETGRFTMGEVLLAEPEISIHQNKNIAQQNAEQNTTESDEEEGNKLLEQVNALVDVFRVQNLKITDGTFTLNMLQDSVQRSQRIENVSVDMEQLQLVSLDASDPLDMFKVDEVGIRVQNYAYISPDSLYLFQIDDLRTSSRERTLHIDSLLMKPLFKIEEYADKLEYAEDRIDLKIKTIAFQDFNLRALFNDQQIIVGQANILSPVLDIYRDNRVDPDPNRRPRTLQHSLLTAPFYIRIDSVSTENGKLTYSEITENGLEPGNLVMNDLWLQLVNITNDTLLIRENNIASAHGTTQLMDESKLQVQFLFDLAHPEDLYTYKGTLESMDFKAFNPLFENITFIRIQSGHINKVEFAIEATKHQSTGQMRFLYENFDILLIDKEDPDNPGFLRKAGSWLINKLVLKSHNPARNGNFREGGIEVERDYSKSVFNHMSNSMMSGITSSMMNSYVERLVSPFLSF